MEPDLVIISRHRRGFWMADLYRDCTVEEQRLSGCAPDDFCTCSDETELRRMVAEAWPEATVVEAEAEDEEEESDVR